MDNNIYNKLAKMREALKKEDIKTFDALLYEVNKKAKTYKVLPLYCFYDKLATLTILDLECITTCVKFQIPVELVGMKKVKEYLYKMAFDYTDEFDQPDSITIKQHSVMLELMEELKVTDTHIFERYKINGWLEMTPDIYQRCMTALERMKNKQQEDLKHG